MRDRGAITLNWFLFIPFNVFKSHSQGPSLALFFDAIITDYFAVFSAIVMELIAVLISF